MHKTYRLGRAPQAVRPRLELRWIVLLAVAAGEVLALSIRFDAGAAIAADGPAPIPPWFRFAPKVAIAVMLAAVVLVGAGLSKHKDLAGAGRRRSDWGAGVGHVAALIGFACLTWAVLEGPARGSGHARVWVAAWAASGIAAAISWALMALPARVYAAVAWRSRYELVAAAALGLLAVYLGRYADRSWNRLGQATLWVSYRLLLLLTPDAVYRPDRFVVGTPSFSVTIAPSCSGYVGIGVITLFLGLYLWAYRARLRFPNALALVPLGAVLMWCANAARIAALVALGTWVSPSVALGGFHSQAGWLAFLGVGLGVCALARNSRAFAARTADGPGRTVVGRKEYRNPTATYLSPMFTVTLVATLSAALTNGFDGFYPLRVVAAMATLWVLRRSLTDALRGWTWSWVPFALGAGAFVMWILLVPTTADDTSGAREALSSLPRPLAVAWVVFRVVGAVVTVPLIEELAFRGYLARRLVAPEFQAVSFRRFSWPAFLASSVLFGVLHDQWLAGTLAGAAYAAAMYSRGRLVDAVVAHAVTNALIAVCVLLGGYWSLWS